MDKKIVFPEEKRVRHVNTGTCPKCAEIYAMYPNFHRGLWEWFKALQRKHPEAHISNAGRGRFLQEQYFKQGSSRARFGQSAHNFNAALDIFRLGVNGAEYGPTWFRDVVGKAVKAHNTANPTFFIKWYGDPDNTRFFELPHCEVDGWEKLNLTPVEPLHAPQSPRPKT